MTHYLEHATKHLEILQSVNPTLNPVELGELFPSYKSFYLHRSGFGLWSSLKSITRVTTSIMQQDRVILALSGPAAGGKDAVRETIERLHPDLSFKAVTATSRPPRDGETHGGDYYFYQDVNDFMAAVERNEFVEWVPQGDRRYGMPKQSLLDALDRQEPVITTHVEMASGWPALDKLAKTGFFGAKKVFPLKVFVLPHMKFSQYAKEWLPSRRDDVETRLLRAAWEISEAATKADFIVTNIIGEDLTSLEWESTAIARECVMLLKDQEAKRKQRINNPLTDSPLVLSRSGRVLYQATKLRQETREKLI